MTPEEMLRVPAETLHSYNTDTWNNLVHHVIEQLIEWLGYEIEVEPIEQACVGDGFCLDILRTCPGKNDLIHWKGILGASIIEDRLRVTLFVFLYSGDQRLVTKGGLEYAECVYESLNSVRGKWRLLGWYKDTYGEFDMY